MPSSSMNLCLESFENVENHLNAYVIGDNNKLDKFLWRGEIIQAAQLSLSILKALNQQSDCGLQSSWDIQHLVKRLQPCILK